MTNNNPVVSVIITTYNREKSLGRAIKSVLKQSYCNIELIVIDNGSTDGTRAVIQSYANSFKIKYIYQRDQNRYIYALNEGINNAEGKYIAVLDDDDFWCDEDKTKKQVSFLEKNTDYVLVGGGLIGIDQGGEEIARYLLPEKDADIKKTILISNTLAHTTVLYRKDAWEKAGGYDEGVDWGLWLRMGKEGKFYNMQEFFIVYTGHARGNPGYLEKKYTRWEWLKINIGLKKKHKSDYPGYRRALLFCWIRYFYSFLPFRLPLKRELWSLLFKIRKL
ncbi:MAG: putative glycosyltransferase [Parcubacteria group bacterium Licking1014_1]|nr:MAG: putative glycosyltransferase [Parcubacteria group bacterium Licking1014_1]